LWAAGSPPVPFGEENTRFGELGVTTLVEDERVLVET